MKKNIIIGLICFIFGITITVTAGILYNAKDIVYKPINEEWKVNNVEEALNDIRNNYFRKANIINALSNKGFDLDDNLTEEQVIENINELPVKIGKNQFGDYGYYNNEKFQMFDSWQIVTDRITCNGNTSWVYRTINIPYKNGIVPTAYITSDQCANELNIFIRTVTNSNLTYGYRGTSVVNRNANITIILKY